MMRYIGTVASLMPVSPRTRPCGPIAFSSRALVPSGSGIVRVPGRGQAGRRRRFSPDSRPPYTRMLATNRRDEPIEAGRGEDVDRLIDAASELQDRPQGGKK